MQNNIGILDGYQKLEGRYPTFKEYLIPFMCNNCRYEWDIDENDIVSAEIDELSHVDDLIENSVTECPLCGSEHIDRLDK